MSAISEFDAVIADLYAEAARHGGIQAIIRAGDVVAIVKDCRPELADRWQAVAVACDSLFEEENHLRLAVIAMQNTIATNKAFLVHQRDFVGLKFEYRVRVADGVDLLA